MKNNVEVNRETGEITLSPKYRNGDNYLLGEYEKDMEKGGGPLMTIPDESFTVAQILEKFTRGVMPDVSRQQVFDDIEDFDGNEQENPIDITDVESQFNEVQQRLKPSVQGSEPAKKAKGSEADESAKEPEETKTEGESR